ncbi:MAG: vWA domain-containing protein [Planctomycetota bacterium]|jgi:hypothetical protein
MTFLSPGALWLLLVLPLVYVFNMVRHRRLPVPAATLAIWRKVLEKGEAPRSSRKNLFNLALLLELLAVSALVIALGRPAAVTGTEGRRVLVVLDTSASMNAMTESGKTRFQKALDVLSDIRGRMNESDSFDIAVTVGSVESVEDGFATDAPADLARAVPGKIAGAAAAGDKIIIITDDPSALDGVVPRKAVVVGVGGTLPNIGIVSAEARRADDSGGEFEIFVRMASAGDAPAPRVEVLGIDENDGPVKIAVTSVKQTGDMFYARCVPGGSDAILVRIRPESTDADSLAADNEVYLYGSRERKVVFELHGKPAPSLMRALSAVESAEIYTVAGDNAPLPDSIPVFIAELPNLPYPKEFICIAPPGALPGFFKLHGAEKTEQAFAESKIAADVDLADFPSAPGAVASLEPLTDVVKYVSAKFEGGPRPLIAKLSTAGETAYVVSFEPDGTPWTGTAGYPLFWAALAEALAIDSGGATTGFRPLGTGVPHGGKISYHAGAEASAGVSFSLLSERETGTRGAGRPLPDKFPDNMKTETANTHEYWGYFILIGMLLLLAESAMIVFSAGFGRGK